MTKVEQVAAPGPVDELRAIFESLPGAIPQWVQWVAFGGDLPRADVSQMRAMAAQLRAGGEDLDEHIVSVKRLIAQHVSVGRFGDGVRGSLRQLEEGGGKLREQAAALADQADAAANEAEKTLCVMLAFGVELGFRVLRILWTAAASGPAGQLAAVSAAEAVLVGGRARVEALRALLKQAYQRIAVQTAAQVPSVSPSQFAVTVARAAALPAGVDAGVQAAQVWAGYRNFAVMGADGSNPTGIDLTAIGVAAAAGAAGAGGGMAAARFGPAVLPAMQSSPLLAGLVHGTTGAVFGMGAATLITGWPQHIDQIVAPLLNGGFAGAVYGRAGAISDTSTGSRGVDGSGGFIPPDTGALAETVPERVGAPRRSLEVSPEARQGWETARAAWSPGTDPVSADTPTLVLAGSADRAEGVGTEPVPTLSAGAQVSAESAGAPDASAQGSTGPAGGSDSASAGGAETATGMAGGDGATDGVPVSQEASAAGSQSGAEKPDPSVGSAASAPGGSDGAADWAAPGRAEPVAAARGDGGDPADSAAAGEGARREGPARAEEPGDDSPALGDSSADPAVESGTTDWSGRQSSTVDVPRRAGSHETPADTGGVPETPAAGEHGDPNSVASGDSVRHDAAAAPEQNSGTQDAAGGYGPSAAGVGESGLAPDPAVRGDGSGITTTARGYDPPADLGAPATGRDSTAGSGDSGVTTTAPGAPRSSEIGVRGPGAESSVAAGSSREGSPARTGSADHGRDASAASRRPSRGDDRSPAGQLARTAERDGAGESGSTTPGRSVSVDEPAGGFRPPHVDPVALRSEGERPSAAGEHENSTAARQRDSVGAEATEGDPRSTGADASADRSAESGESGQRTSDAEAAPSGRTDAAPSARPDPEALAHEVLADFYGRSAEGIPEHLRLQNLSDEALQAGLFHPDERESLIATMEIIRRQTVSEDVPGGMVLRVPQLEGLFRMEHQPVQMLPGQGKTLMFMAATMRQAVGAYAGHPGAGDGSVLLVTTTDGLAYREFVEYRRVMQPYGIDVLRADQQTGFGDIQPGRPTIVVATGETVGHLCNAGHTPPRSVVIDEMDGIVDRGLQTFIRSDRAAEAASDATREEVIAADTFLQEALTAQKLSYADFGLKRLTETYDVQGPSGTFETAVKHWHEGKATLTPEGRARIAEIPGGDRWLQGMGLSRLEMAAAAEFTTHNKTHYVISNGKIVIIGQTEHGLQYNPKTSSETRWSAEDGRASLAQAVEAKELRLAEKNGQTADEHRIVVRADAGTDAQTTAAEIYRTGGKFFDRVTGASGTLSDLGDVLNTVYGLETPHEVAPYNPSKLIQGVPDVHENTHAKLTAIAEYAHGIRENTGRFQLVLCDRNDLVDKQVTAMVKAGIPREAIEAVDADRITGWDRDWLDGTTAIDSETQLQNIFDAAGERGKILVINRQGQRGVDISVSDDVLARGGMHVWLTEVPEQSYIYDQATNRTARNGQPGTAQALMSPQDTLIRNALHLRGVREAVVTYEQAVKAVDADDTPQARSAVTQAREGLTDLVSGLQHRAHVRSTAEFLYHNTGMSKEEAELHARSHNPGSNDQLDDPADRNARLAGLLGISTAQLTTALGADLLDIDDTVSIRTEESHDGHTRAPETDTNDTRSNQSRILDPTDIRSDPSREADAPADRRDPAHDVDGARPDRAHDSESGAAHTGVPRNPLPGISPAAMEALRQQVDATAPGQTARYALLTNEEALDHLLPRRDRLAAELGWDAETIEGAEGLRHIGRAADTARHEFLQALESAAGHRAGTDPNHDDISPALSEVTTATAREKLGEAIVHHLSGAANNRRSDTDPTADSAIVDAAVTAAASHYLATAALLDLITEIHRSSPNSCVNNGVTAMRVLCPENADKFTMPPGGPPLEGHNWDTVKASFRNQVPTAHRSLDAAKTTLEQLPGGVQVLVYKWKNNTTKATTDPDAPEGESSAAEKGRDAEKKDISDADNHLVLLVNKSDDPNRPELVVIDLSASRSGDYAQDIGPEDLAGRETLLDKAVSFEEWQREQQKFIDRVPESQRLFHTIDFDRAGNTPPDRGPRGEPARERTAEPAPDVDEVRQVFYGPDNRPTGDEIPDSPAGIDLAGMNSAVPPNTSAADRRPEPAFTGSRPHDFDMSPDAADRGADPPTNDRVGSSPSESGNGSAAANTNRADNRPEWVSIPDPPYPKTIKIARQELDRELRKKFGDRELTAMEREEISAKRLPGIQQYAHVDRNIERLATALGMRSSKLRETMRAELRAALADKPVAIRMDAESLISMLNDGVYRPAYPPDTERTRFEEQWLMEKPTYGYVAVDGIRPSGPAGLDMLTTEYGLEQVILKPGIRSFTSITRGDFEINKTTSLPSPLVNPLEWSFGAVPGPEYNNRGAVRIDRNSSYFQAQILRQVTVDDIAEIVLHKEPSPRLLEALDRRGIACRVLNNSTVAEYGDAAERAAALTRVDDHLAVLRTRARNLGSSYTYADRDAQLLGESVQLQRSLATSPRRLTEGRASEPVWSGEESTGNADHAVPEAVRLAGRNAELIDVWVADAVRDGLVESGTEAEIVQRVAEAVLSRVLDDTREHVDVVAAAAGALGGVVDIDRAVPVINRMVVVTLMRARYADDHTVSASARARTTVGAVIQNLPELVKDVVPEERTRDSGARSSDVADPRIRADITRQAYQAVAEALGEGRVSPGVEANAVRAFAETVVSRLEGIRLAAEVTDLAVRAGDIAGGVAVCEAVVGGIAAVGSADTDGRVVVAVIAENQLDRSKPLSEDDIAAIVDRTAGDIVSRVATSDFRRASDIGRVVAETVADAGVAAGGRDGVAARVAEAVRARVAGADDNPNPDLATVSAMTNAFAAAVARVDGATSVVVARVAAEVFARLSKVKEFVPGDAAEIVAAVIDAVSLWPEHGKVARDEARADDGDFPGSLIGARPDTSVTGQDGAQGRIGSRPSEPWDDSAAAPTHSAVGAFDSTGYSTGRGISEQELSAEESGGNADQAVPKAARLAGRNAEFIALRVAHAVRDGRVESETEAEIVQRVAEAILSRTVGDTRDHVEAAAAAATAVGSVVDADSAVVVIDRIVAEILGRSGNVFPDDGDIMMSALAREIVDVVIRKVPDIVNGVVPEGGTYDSDVRSGVDIDPELGGDIARQAYAAVDAALVDGQVLPGPEAEIVRAIAEEVVSRLEGLRIAAEAGDVAVGVALSEAVIGGIAAAGRADASARVAVAAIAARQVYRSDPLSERHIEAIADRAAADIVSRASALGSAPAYDDVGRVIAETMADAGVAAGGRDGVVARVADAVRARVAETVGTDDSPHTDAAVVSAMTDVFADAVARVGDAAGVVVARMAAEIFTRLSMRDTYTSGSASAGTVADAVVDAIGRGPSRWVADRVEVRADDDDFPGGLIGARPEDAMGDDVAEDVRASGLQEGADGPGAQRADRENIDPDVRDDGELIAAVRTGDRHAGSVRRSDTAEPDHAGEAPNETSSHDSGYDPIGRIGSRPDDPRPGDRDETVAGAGLIGTSPAPTIAQPGWRVWRLRHEVALARELYHRPESRRAAVAMLDRLRAVLTALHPAATAEQIDAAFYAPENTSAGGMVRRSVPLDELRAEGNLRELMSAVYNAMLRSGELPENPASTTLDDGVAALLNRTGWEREAADLGLDVAALGQVREWIVERNPQGEVGKRDLRDVRNTVRYPEDRTIADERTRSSADERQRDLREQVRRGLTVQDWAVLGMPLSLREVEAIPGPLVKLRISRLDPHRVLPRGVRGRVDVDALESRLQAVDRILQRKHPVRFILPLYEYEENGRRKRDRAGNAVVSDLLVYRDVGEVEPEAALALDPNRFAVPLPWGPGVARVDLDREGPWFGERALEQGYPLLAGLSGTSARFASRFSWLRPEVSDTDFAGAILAFLSPQHHSLYEQVRGMQMSGLHIVDEEILRAPTNAVAELYQAVFDRFDIPVPDGSARVAPFSARTSGIRIGSRPDDNAAVDRAAVEPAAGSRPGDIKHPRSVVRAALGDPVQVNRIAALVADLPEQQRAGVAEWLEEHGGVVLAGITAPKKVTGASANSTTVGLGKLAHRLVREFPELAVVGRDSSPRGVLESMLSNDPAWEARIEEALDSFRDDGRWKPRFENFEKVVLEGYTASEWAEVKGHARQVVARSVQTAADQVLRALSGEALTEREQAALVRRPRLYYEYFDRDGSRTGHGDPDTAAALKIVEEVRRTQRAQLSVAIRRIDDSTARNAALLGLLRSKSPRRIAKELGTDEGDARAILAATARSLARQLRSSIDVGDEASTGPIDRGQAEGSREGGPGRIGSRPHEDETSADRISDAMGSPPHFGAPERPQPNIGDSGMSGIVSSRLSESPVPRAPRRHPMDEYHDPQIIRRYDNDYGLTRRVGEDGRPLAPEGIFASVDVDGILRMQVKASERTPRGFAMVAQMEAEIGHLVTGIQDYWTDVYDGLTSNIDRFNTLLRENPELSPEDAAARTFTGRMAARRGFTDIRCDHFDGDRGYHHNVIVTFTRPGNASDAGVTPGFQPGTPDSIGSRPHFELEPDKTATDGTAGAQSASPPPIHADELSPELAGHGVIVGFAAAARGLGMPAPAVPDVVELSVPQWLYRKLAAEGWSAVHVQHRRPAGAGPVATAALTRGRLRVSVGWDGAVSHADLVERSWKSDTDGLRFAGLPDVYAWAQERNRPEDVIAGDWIKDRLLGPDLPPLPERIIEREIGEVTEALYTRWPQGRLDELDVDVPEIRRGIRLAAEGLFVNRTLYGDPDIGRANQIYDDAFELREYGVGAFCHNGMDIAADLGLLVENCLLQGAEPREIVLAVAADAWSDVVYGGGRRSDNPDNYDELRSARLVHDRALVHGLSSVTARILGFAVNATGFDERTKTQMIASPEAVAESTEQWDLSPEEFAQAMRIGRWVTAADLQTLSEPEALVQSIELALEDLMSRRFSSTRVFGRVLNEWGERVSTVEEALRAADRFGRLFPEGDHVMVRQAFLDRLRGTVGFLDPDTGYRAPEGWLLGNRAMRREHAAMLRDITARLAGDSTYTLLDAYRDAQAHASAMREKYSGFGWELVVRPNIEGWDSTDIAADVADRLPDSVPSELAPDLLDAIPRIGDLARSSVDSDPALVVSSVHDSRGYPRLVGQLSYIRRPDPYPGAPVSLDLLRRRVPDVNCRITRSEPLSNGRVRESIEFDFMSRPGGSADRPVPADPAAEGFDSRHRPGDSETSPEDRIGSTPDDEQSAVPHEPSAAAGRPAGDLDLIGSVDARSGLPSYVPPDADHRARAEDILRSHWGRGATAEDLAFEWQEYRTEQAASLAADDCAVHAAQNARRIPDLDVDELRTLVRVWPEYVGKAGGFPREVRDQANRWALARAIHELEVKAGTALEDAAAIDHLSGPEKALRKYLLNSRDLLIRAVHRAVTVDTPGVPEPTVLLEWFDTGSPGAESAIVSLGSAQPVAEAWHVDGSANDLRRLDQRMQLACNHYEVAARGNPDRPVRVVMWSGTDGHRLSADMAALYTAPGSGARIERQLLVHGRGGGEVAKAALARESVTQALDAVIVCDERNIDALGAALADLGPQTELYYGVTSRAGEPASAVRLPGRQFSSRFPAADFAFRTAFVRRMNLRVAGYEKAPFDLGKPIDDEFLLYIDDRTKVGTESLDNVGRILAGRTDRLRLFDGSNGVVRFSEYLPGAGIGPVSPHDHALPRDQETGRPAPVVNATVREVARTALAPRGGPEALLHRELPDDFTRAHRLAAANRQWWDELSTNQQRAVVAAYPEILSRAPGIPSEVATYADEYYRRTVYAEIYREVSAKGISRVSRADVFRNLVAIDEALTRSVTVHRDIPRPIVSTMGVDPNAFGGNGAGTFFIGNSRVEDAEHIVWYVDGVNTSLQSAPTRLASARNLYEELVRADPSTKVVVACWIGYEAPANNKEQLAATATLAEAGGRLFARDVLALRAVTNARMSKLGYSYGSLVVSTPPVVSALPVLIGRPGYAFEHSIVGASPGRGTRYDSATDTSSRYRWSGAQSSDPISALGADAAGMNGRLLGSGPLGHGLDPTVDRNVVRLPSERGFPFTLDPYPGHGFDLDYALASAAQPTEFLHYVALILVGRGDEVPREAHRRIIEVPSWTHSIVAKVDDPAADRRAMQLDPALAPPGRLPLQVGPAGETSARADGRQEPGTTLDRAEGFSERPLITAQFAVNGPQHARRSLTNALGLGVDSVAVTLGSDRDITEFRDLCRALAVFNDAAEQDVSVTATVKAGPKWSDEEVRARVGEIGDTLAEHGVPGELQAVDLRVLAAAEDLALGYGRVAELNSLTVAGRGLRGVVGWMARSIYPGAKDIDALLTEAGQSGATAVAVPYQLLSEDLVQRAGAMGMQVAVWNVTTIDRMRNAIRLGTQEIRAEADHLALLRAAVAESGLRTPESPDAPTFLLEGLIGSSPDDSGPDTTEQQDSAPHRAGPDEREPAAGPGVHSPENSDSPETGRSPADSEQSNPAVTGEAGRPQFRVESTETVYSGPTFDMLQSHVRMPDGKVLPRDVIDVPATVAVVPVDRQGRALLTRRFRPAVGAAVLELPTGVLPVDTDPLQAAEQILAANGLRAGGAWSLATDMVRSGGLSNAVTRVLVAREVEDLDDAQQAPNLFRMPLEEAIAEVVGGDTVDSAAAVGVLAAAAETFGDIALRPAADPPRRPLRAARNAPPSDLVGRYGAQPLTPVGGEITMYRSPANEVRRVRFETPDGGVVEQDMVTRRSAVMVLPWDERTDEVVLVRQYRPALDRWVLQLPAGTLDKSGEDPLAGVRRELAEEAGIAAREWGELVNETPLPWISSERRRIYLARDLSAVSRPDSGESDEIGMGQVRLSAAEALDLALRGEIDNGAAVFALLSLVAVKSGRLRPRPVGATSPSERDDRSNGLDSRVGGDTTGGSRIGSRPSDDGRSAAEGQVTGTSAPPSSSAELIDATAGHQRPENIDLEPVAETAAHSGRSSHRRPTPESAERGAAEEPSRDMPAEMGSTPWSAQPRFDTAEPRESGDTAVHDGPAEHAGSRRQSTNEHIAIGDRNTHFSAVRAGAGPFGRTPFPSPWLVMNSQDPNKRARIQIYSLWQARVANRGWAKLVSRWDSANSSDERRRRLYELYWWISHKRYQWALRSDALKAEPGEQDMHPSVLRARLKGYDYKRVPPDKFRSRHLSDHPGIDTFGAKHREKDGSRWDDDAQLWRGGKETPAFETFRAIGEIIRSRFDNDAPDADVLQNIIELYDGTLEHGNTLYRGRAAEEVNTARQGYDRGRVDPFDPGAEKFITVTAHPENQRRIFESAIAEMDTALSSPADRSAEAARHYANAIYMLFQAPLIMRGSDTVIRTFASIAGLLLFGEPPILPHDVDVQAYSRSQSNFVRWLTDFLSTSASSPSGERRRVDLSYDTDGELLPVGPPVYPPFPLDDIEPPPIPVGTGERPREPWELDESDSPRGRGRGREHGTDEHQQTDTRGFGRESGAAGSPPLPISGSGNTEPSSGKATPWSRKNTQLAEQPEATDR
ncbi:NUDIX domain-containing protein [Nocardia donostiensis]|uniref:SecA family profile domain-containing protein n=1 Tax=Nocardia donostiensis TaxID=1538463 RepID=A0A1W0B8Y1_9NOCA|nr:NUDIX domain-containing protein [Nocardia donostiensis]ONM48492.1 hypothetical protein B0T46_12405 [Nocardia donostiensis]OQS18983.1 hypothetical protein B0T44_16595 [Nocardia donostiensis]